MSEELFVRLQNAFSKLRVYFENPNQLGMPLFLQGISNELVEISKEIQEHAFSLMEF